MINNTKILKLLVSGISLFEKNILSKKLSEKLFKNIKLNTGIIITKESISKKIPINNRNENIDKNLTSFLFSKKVIFLSICLKIFYIKIMMSFNRIFN